MKRLKINSSVESFLVMILMAIFAISVSFIIMEGQSAFERVTENKLQDEQARVAFSYVNKRIKQNDVEGAVKLVTVEGFEALEISELIYGDDWKTYIFYKDGYMYECYTDVEPTVELSTIVVAVEDLKFTIEEGRIHTTLLYEYRGEMIELTQITSLRSGGNDEK